MKVAALKYQFVTSAPEQPEEGILYVSLSYRTAIHKCCCGCGHEVVTPFSPTDWKLTFDGVSVSLYPSIGNWGLPCRSHYFIERGRIKWANEWSDAQIAAGRAHDRQLKERYYGGRVEPEQTPPEATLPDNAPPPRAALWKRIAKLWS
jgi:hypothetical protein